MKPLTIEYSIEKKYTPIDCVKYFKPDWTDEKCNFYLWEFTCYPFSMESTITQLNNQLLTLPTGDKNK